MGSRATSNRILPCKSIHYREVCQMAGQRTVLDDQLEARAEWEKYQISGETEHAVMALHFAEAAGFGANEKTALIRNVPELSKAFDDGRSNAEADWAISLLEPGAKLDYRSLSFVTPEPGKTYQGRIIHGDADTIYQAAVVDGEDVIVPHPLSDLSSVESNTFAFSPLEVSIRYIADGVAVGKLVQPL